MTDIQTTAQNSGQQQLTIFFGGQMDQVMMGAPVYFWIIFFLLMGLIVMGFFVLYYRLYILDKIWAFVDCYRKRKPLALIRNRNRQAYFKPLEYVAQVFYDDQGPDRWLSSSLESSQSIAGVPLVDACDYYDWLQDPIQNQAILEIINAWNNGIYEDDGIDEEGNRKVKTIKPPHPDNEKIYDPVHFQQLLGSGKLKDYFDSTEVVVYKKGSVKLSAFFVIDVSRTEQYLPKTRSSSMFGGYTVWLSEQVGAKENKDKYTMMTWFIIGCVSLIICGIIAGLLATGKL